MSKRWVLLALVVSIATLAISQETGKLRVFVAGNNATALEVRRTMEKFTSKPNPKSKFCMILVDNPKDADATLSVESIVNGRSMGAANYTSSAQLTSADGTLLWSDSVGDGSKFMDVMVGGSPGIAASRLLTNAAKKVCKH
ncbi:MAG: hypothetical protein ABSG52_00600 [Terriglobales bacterium]|jgi:uncharacterized cupredoxin-like copper-binding protein